MYIASMSNMNASNAPLFDCIWQTKDLKLVRVRDMTRDHVRNALQWVTTREPRSNLYSAFWENFRLEDGTMPEELDNIYCDKDGKMYRDWAAIFLARLLDPDLPE